MIATALALILAGAGVVSPVAIRPVSLATYVHQVHALSRELRGHSKLTAASTVKVRADLESLGSVRLPDGAVLSTGLPAIATSIVPGDAGSLRRASIQLAALDRALRESVAIPANQRQLSQLDTI